VDFFSSDKKQFNHFNNNKNKTFKNSKWLLIFQKIISYHVLFFIAIENIAVRYFAKRNSSGSGLFFFHEALDLLEQLIGMLGGQGPEIKGLFIIYGNINGIIGGI